ncbi:MAG: cytochrome b, partial [Corynebacterium variabile]
LANFHLGGGRCVHRPVGLLVVLLFAYPWIEQHFTKDNAHHNLLQRPRDVPVRTSLGVMAMMAYFVLTLSGGNDLFALHFQISLNAMTWIGRIGFLVLPPIAYFVTYRICLGLQRNDRAVLEHGIETGTIRQLPNGGFIEVHQPIGPVDEHGHPIPLEYAGAQVPTKLNQLGFAGQPGRGGFFRPDPEDIVSKVSEIEEANEHEKIEMLRRLNEANRAALEDKGHSNP